MYGNICICLQNIYSPVHIQHNRKHFSFLHIIGDFLLLLLLLWTIAIIFYTSFQENITPLEV